MESQDQGFIQNAAATNTNKNTMILNSECSYAHNKAVETCCFLNAEKMRHGKRVLDMECKNDFQENIKKAKRQTDVNDAATTSTALYQPAETRYNEIKKPTDAVKNGEAYEEKREKLLKSFVNSRGKPACLICRVNYVSNKSLYRHMALHSDEEWKTFIRSRNTHNANKSGEDHNHDSKVDNLSKCLFGWNVKKGKRGPLGSSVAYVKEAAKILVRDHGDVDEDVIEAAKILVRDHQLKAKQSMMAQTKVEAANCLMCLADPVTPPIGRITRTSYTVHGNKLDREACTS